MEGVNSPLRHFSSLVMRAPTRKDGTLPATPRRIRLNSLHAGHGEVLNFYTGKPYPAKVAGVITHIQTGDYVGVNLVLSHAHVLTHPQMWEMVGEPFPVLR